MKPSPESRECLYCGLPLVRKPGEPPANFKARVYHDRACHAADRVRRNAVARSAPVAPVKQSVKQLRPMVNDPFAGFMQPLALAPFSEPSPVVIQVPELLREAVIKAVGIRNMRGALS